MNRTAGRFVKAAVVYAVIGFVLGVAMGASNDFTMRSVHTHINLLGWVSMAVYGMYYQLVPHVSGRALAGAHFWISNAGLIILSASLALMAGGMPEAAAGAGVGSMIILLSLLLFAFVVFKYSGEERLRA